jgi:hypothetical protein
VICLTWKRCKVSALETVSATNIHGYPRNDVSDGWVRRRWSHVLKDDGSYGQSLIRAGRSVVNKLILDLSRSGLPGPHS